MPQCMGLLDRPAAGLAWLGRHGTNAVAISILLGIALPPLGALIRPFFPETVFLLLCLAFLRVDPGALRAQFAKPWLHARRRDLDHADRAGAGGLEPAHARSVDRSPGLLLALMLNVVAPPIFASPALAALMGLNAAVTLALLLACIAATPFLAPALVALFVESGGDVLAARAWAAPRADAGRRGLRRHRRSASIAGKPWVERQAERIDGLNVIVLFLFAVALMGDVRPTRSRIHCSCWACSRSRPQ